MPISGVYPAPIVLQINDYDPLGFQHFNNQEGKNNFIFQKQERILDLGLGYDFWKFRYSDAATGRFWMIDPLGSDFAHNSLYSFQENKLGKGVELEGAELAEFGRYLGGVGSGIAEDISFGAFRAGSGTPEYNAGVSAGHKASVAIGVGTTVIGRGIVLGSGVATAVSLGTLTPATALTATGGAAIAMYGGAITAKALSSVNSEGGEAKSRNNPKENGIPNSSEIQSRNTNGKVDKYTTYGENGKITKEYRGSGKDHGNLPRPNVKEPKYNVNPKTGEKFQNGYEVRKAKNDEIPK